VTGGRRQVLMRGPALAAALLALGGCALGPGRSSQVWWELADARAGAPGRAAVRRPRVLAVEGVAAGALYDGIALLYSRGPGMRAPYQYANWTERPARRLARLAQHRLAQRGGFREVVPVDAGIAPDLLLTLTLHALHHALPDDGEAGRLILTLEARLIDWRGRQPLASETFEAVEAVTEGTAAAAVAAAGRACADVLDELAPWVEQAAGRQAVSGSAGPVSGKVRLPGAPPSR